MKFFIDTAKVEDIKKANDMGVICGVTTNPSLIAKEGRVFEEVIAEIASIVDGPISGEVKATTVDAEGMIEEGRKIAAIHPNMVVKLPMTVEGLKACKALTAEGIKTNVTLIFTANQALLAARAGATYVSPFLGRLDDISVRGTDLIAEIAEIFRVADIKTEIIAASVRHTMHVTDCALAGAHIATVPYAVIEQMTKHPLTDAGIDEFERLMFEISAKPISILLDFNAVIVNLEHLSKKNQQKCLAQIEDNVKALKSSIEENVLQKEKNTEIPEAGKAVLRQQLALAEAVETWIAALKSDFAARSDRRRDGN